MCVDIRGNPENTWDRACLWELRMGGCLAQGLSYEVGALVVVFINKGAPAEVGVWRSGTPLRWGCGGVGYH